jgi:hypothetical protein
VIWHRFTFVNNGCTQVYTRDGVELQQPAGDVELWKGVDLVAVRCPHAESAARMSTLIRQVGVMPTRARNTVCYLDPAAWTFSFAGQIRAGFYWYVPV